jgi:glycosyltransferase involved in cell wall biosynthesis
MGSLSYEYFNPRVFSKERKNIDNVVNQYNIDIIHCHDLPLVKTATIVAKKHNIPIIADLHESFPESLKAWRKELKSIKLKIINRMFFPLPIQIYERFEKSILKNVDEIITIAYSGKERYINQCLIKSDKITVVMNTEDINEFEKLDLDRSITQKYKDNYVISLIGVFAPYRGIETAIRSMPKIIEKIPNAKLILVGGKGDESFQKMLMQLCNKLNIEKYVEFTGWVDFKFVPSYIDTSDVCLDLRISSGHSDTGVSHKLFQYMIMKKPVVVSDSKSLKQIVKEYNCGIVTPSRNHEKVAEAIIKLYKDRAWAKKLGENGRRAVEEKYNWEKAGTKLTDLYENISS